MSILHDSRPTHEHPCGHDCQCVWGNSQLCDRCEIAEVLIRRHHLTDMSRGRALARLYLAMQQELAKLELGEASRG